MGKRDPFSNDASSPPSSNGISEDFSDFDLNAGGSGGRRSSGGPWKLILIVLALGVLVGGGIFFFTNQEENEGFFTSEEAAKPAPKKTPELAPKKESIQTMIPPNPPKQEPAPMIADKNKQSPDVNGTTKPSEVLPQDFPTPKPGGCKGSCGGGGGGLRAKTPEDGAVRNYDETSNHAEFTWTGKSQWILFSRNSNMHPVELKAKTKGHKFIFPRPDPGVWYWRLVNGSHKTPVRSFHVNPPVKRAIAITSPAGGATLSKDGSVTWKGDHMVTYYRVEISNSGWTNPAYKFATTGTELRLQNVAAGQYQLRVGGFSEVSGRWEYTEPIAVTIQ